MLKLEHKLIKERGIVAIAIEAKSDADLPELDLVVAALHHSMKDTICKGAYLDSKRYVLHIRGMDPSIFKEDLDSLSDKNVV